VNAEKLPKELRATLEEAKSSVTEIGVGVEEKQRMGHCSRQAAESVVGLLVEAKVADVEGFAKG
jgi:hypothetical protein